MSKFCGVCDENIGSATWEEHNKGYSHVKTAQQKDHSIILEIQGGWHNISQNELLYFFSKFGPIVKINQHSKVFPPLGYAYVEFSSPEVVNRVTSQTFHKLRGYLVKVSRWTTEKQRNSKAELEQKDTLLTKEKEKKFLQDLFSSVKLGTSTEEQLKQLVWMHELPLLDQKAGEVLRAEIEKIIKPYIPEARVNLIGSHHNGLGVRGCDINLEVELDREARRPKQQFLPKAPKLPPFFIKQTGMAVSEGRLSYASLLDETNLVETLWFIYEILQNSQLGLNVSDIQLYDGQGSYSKRNKISIKHLRYKNDIEIQVKVGRSINYYICRLVRLLVQLDDRVRPLYITVRFWAKQVGVFNVFTSYGMFLLVYFYLQNTKPPILPSVETLSKMCAEHEKQYVRSSLVSFCTDLIRIQEQCLTPKNTQSMSELLQGFFKFYAKFELPNRVFCPHSGRSYNMLKFRNMKKVISNLSTFDLKDRCFHIQDVFRSYFNVISPSHYINKHTVCLEFLRATTIVRDEPDKAWNLLCVFPMKAITSQMDSILQKAPIVIPFEPAMLPDGFLSYSSYSEAERQWYQWVVEITMRVLQILRITYTLEGDFGEETNVTKEGKRALSESLSNNKRHKNEAEAMLHTSERVAAMDFETCFEPERTVVQDSRLRCTDKYYLWNKRPKSVRGVVRKTGDILSVEESISQNMLETNASTSNTPNEFTLNIQHVKTNNETQIEMGGEAVNDTYQLLTFMNFFQDFVMKIICKEVGLDVTVLSAKFRS